MIVQELIGRRFKDGYNVIPEISLRKRGNVDCVGCLVKAR